MAIISNIPLKSEVDIADIEGLNEALKLPEGSLTTKGIVQLSNDITSTSITHAATSSAVNEVYTLAKSAYDSPKLPEGSLTTKGIVQLSADITSTSTKHAATPSAVNEVYKLAKSAYEKAQSAYLTNTTSVITINSIPDAVLTITKDEETVEVTIGTSGTAIAEVTSGTGTYNVIAALNGKTWNDSFDVDYIGNHEVFLYFPVSFETDDYDIITMVSKRGLAKNYYNIGDKRLITLNGLIYTSSSTMIADWSNYPIYMFIIDFDHNKDIEMNGEHHIVCSIGLNAETHNPTYLRTTRSYGSEKENHYFNMGISTVTTSGNGGWGRCTIRSKICPDFIQCLPSDLQEILRTRTIYSDNTGKRDSEGSHVTSTEDKLFLLSEFEIFGTIKNSNPAEANYQKQYTYYSSNPAIRYYNTGSTENGGMWWTRSTNYNSDSMFCCVGGSGSSGTAPRTTNMGFAPCFTI